MPQRIALLGSTGSIGTQTLDVISRFPDEFIVDLLTAGNNATLLIQQAKKFKPDHVIIGNPGHFAEVKEALAGTGIKVSAGEKEIEQGVRSSSADTVVAAMVGYSGLKPALAAVESGKKLALANKETLVVAGEIISAAAKKSGSQIIPVDSEHSAIFQCLAGEIPECIDYITLTASGGPFLNLSVEDLKNVKPEDALKHPNWCMGAKVTIDSASMMNKGLEVIEAHWLFNLEAPKIKVIIHPQSIIHSFVHFIDGSVKAQMGIPDMRVPIIYALTHPSRLNTGFPSIDFRRHASLTFLEPDLKRFRNLSLAYEALSEGGNVPCIMNAANEVAVESFLAGQISFTEMSAVVENAMEKIERIASPSLEELGESDKEARILSKDFIKKFKLTHK